MAELDLDKKISQANNGNIHTRPVAVADWLKTIGRMDSKYVIGGVSLIGLTAGLTTAAVFNYPFAAALGTGIFVVSGQIFCSSTDALNL